MQTIEELKKDCIDYATSRKNSQSYEAYETIKSKMRSFRILTSDEWIDIIKPVCKLLGI